MLHHQPGKEWQQIGYCPLADLIFVLFQIRNLRSCSRQITADQKKHGHLNGFYHIIQIWICHMVMHLYMAKHDQKDRNTLQTVQGFISLFHTISIYT